MYFVEDRTLFAVDVMSVKSVGFFDFSNENFPALVEAVRNLQRIDYDHLVDSHGPLGTKADGDTYLAYLEDLESGVRRELARGASLEETQRDIHLDRYQHLALYGPWSATNIEGAYVALKGEPVRPTTVTDSPAPSSGRRCAQRGAECPHPRAGCFLQRLSWPPRHQCRCPLPQSGGTEIRVSFESTAGVSATGTLRSIHVAARISQRPRLAGDRALLQRPRRDALNTRSGGE